MTSVCIFDMQLLAHTPEKKLITIFSSYFLNKMPNRTLLPIWKIYKKTVPLKPEPFENFEFIANESDRADYIIAREALYKIPGSHEYLKNYTFDENTKFHFADPTGSHILAKLGPHHSGASSTRLALNYSYLLNHWDNFVQDLKVAQLKAFYDATQLTESTLQQYGAAYNQPLKAYEIATAIKHKYGLAYTVDMVIIMLDDLIQEYKNDYSAKISADLKQLFDMKVDVLKHHYEYPNRWNDGRHGSSLFGSPMLISEEMICAVEQKYPDYRTHIKAIQDEFTSSK